MPVTRLETAQAALEESGVLNQLTAFNPTVVSTIWAGLDIPESDIDILCCYACRESFAEKVSAACRELPQFELQLREDYVLARCRVRGFQIEIYASPEPITKQSAWRHFVVMQRLVHLASPSFASAVRTQKMSGKKTEPAIAEVLRLEGEPFAAVLALQQQSDTTLQELLKQAGHLPSASLN